MTILHNNASLLSIGVILPILRFLTNKRMDHVTRGNDEIISLIREINPNKATGSGRNIRPNVTYYVTNLSFYLFK